LQIDGKYSQLGGAGSFLGSVIGSLQASKDGTGFFKVYQGGSIYFNPGTGAHEVHGAIRDHWASLGSETGFLGYPLTDEAGSPDGIGRYNVFQNGSVYWTFNTGAYELHGAIRDKWNTLGSETGFLGYPLTDETGTPDGIGRYNVFQNGSVYWTPNTGAHEVHGAIRDEWAALGWERSAVGYPITDETGTPDGIGRYNHFQAGSIYWTPRTGAHEVQGAIRDKWASLGWERSYLGYPTSDETGFELPFLGQGRISHFERGDILWTPGGGAVDSPASSHGHVDITFPDPISVGGWSDLTLKADGSYEFSGHLHDSGAPDFNFNVAWGVRDSDGVLYTFVQTGGVQGLQSGFSPQRDADWAPTGSNAALSTAWSKIPGPGAWVCRSSVAFDVNGLINELLNDVQQLVGYVEKVIAIVGPLLA
jgi:uncharacterized protein with LGFP repeats